LLIIAKFTQDIGDHQNTGSQAYGQSKNIYERKNLIPRKVSVSDLKIIPEHGIGLSGFESEISNSGQRAAVLTIAVANGMPKC
jgi:hypothetical protein